jgi:signal transduction histidine kinase
MTARRDLTRRLGRELLLQAAYISGAVLVGIFIAANLIPDFMIRQALEQEADYYWSRVQENPQHPLPDTLNLTAYRPDKGIAAPTALSGLPPGYHHQDDPVEQLIFISERNGQRLYLVFEEAQVNRLLVLFGLIPLALALIVVYLSLYAGYRTSRRAVSPVVALAERVQRLDPAEPDASLARLEQPAEADSEIHVLSEALQDLIHRVTEFTERERRFTRDASHELRTPLTVIRMAVDRLLRDGDLDENSSETLLRIRKSAEDMEHLTAAFLLLARDAGSGLPGEWVCVNDLVESELERARIVNPDSPITIETAAECRLLVYAHDQVLASVVGNLLRNALSYTDSGSVRVHIGRDRVTIEDTGPGMDEQQVEEAFKAFHRGGRRRGGFGVGLTIVKRLTGYFGWPLDIQSEPDRGTRVSVQFPDARSEPVSRELHGA